MRKERKLRDMRKRRVGVTAGSWLVVGNRETGTPQTATEIAAPLVSRTPRGTVAAATIECGWKRGDTTGVKDNRQGPVPEEWRRRERGSQDVRGGRRAEARMRRCLILRQGASPLRPPAPFPWDFDCTDGKKSVKGTLRRQRAAALDRFLPIRRASGNEGKGALQGRVHACLPLVGTERHRNLRTYT